MLQGRFTWQEGNYTTSQHDQVFAMLQECSENNLTDEQGQQYPLILGSKGEHAAMASQKTPDVWLGQETFPKSLIPPSRF